MLKKIKNFLGRFLPLPANSAHRMNKEMLKEFDLVKSEINLLRVVSSEITRKDVEKRKNLKLDRQTVVHFYEKADERMTSLYEEFKNSEMFKSMINQESYPPP